MNLPAVSYLRSLAADYTADTEVYFKICRSLSVMQWWRGPFDALGGLAAAFDCEVVCILIIWVKFKGGFGRLGSLTRLSVGWLLRCVRWMLDD